MYAGTKSSRCFSDHFLIKAEKETSISTSRRFHAVKLSSDNIYEFPLVIMTGEGDFQLSAAERETLPATPSGGGFAGLGRLFVDRMGPRVSAARWPRSFPTTRSIDRHEPSRCFIRSTISRSCHHARRSPRPLVGVSIGGRLGVIYSQDGLNDTPNTTGCCCCGGNELGNAMKSTSISSHTR